VTRNPFARNPLARNPFARTALAVALVAGVAVGCGGDDDTADRPSPSSAAGPSASAAPPSITAALDDALRLNEIQVVGTHNSFHREHDPAELDLLATLDAEQAAQRTYGHETLGEQLAAQQVRQIELDVFADGSGGLYASPSLRRQAGLADLVESVPEMAEPGTKVLHEQDVDYHSVCPTLVRCLAEVKEWSDANPDHVPVAIFIQFKDGPLIFPVADQAVPEKWVPEAMDRMEDEIRSVFDADDLLTPDDVRGTRATLEEAVTTDGWPTLGETRGTVLFAMVNGEPYRSLYLEGHPGLAGRLLFTNAEPGQPDAAVLNVDDPLAEPGRIAELVGRGYLVRTRADTPNVHARTNDTTRRDAALASGAHWIGTDYPVQGMAPGDFGAGTDYVVELPDARAARCNPVTAPPTCRDEAVEP
jgi:hypothetical protein